MGVSPGGGGCGDPSPQQQVAQTSSSVCKEGSSSSSIFFPHCPEPLYLVERWKLNPNKCRTKLTHGLVCTRTIFRISLKGT